MASIRNSLCDSYNPEYEYTRYLKQQTQYAYQNSASIWGTDAYLPSGTKINHDYSNKNNKLKLLLI